MSQAQQQRCHHPAAAQDMAGSNDSQQQIVCRMRNKVLLNSWPRQVDGWLLPRSLSRVTFMAAASLPPADPGTEVPPPQEQKKRQGTAASHTEPVLTLRGNPCSSVAHSSTQTADREMSAKAVKRWKRLVVLYQRRVM